nr:hypothetical protein [Defluviicoccus vanus]
MNLDLGFHLDAAASDAADPVQVVEASKNSFGRQPAAVEPGDDLFAGNR